MNTFWKKMAAFGFGVAFSLLSSTVVLAAGEGEGFDFTDEKSASEEWNAMKKQKEEVDVRYGRAFLSISHYASHQCEYQSRRRIYSSDEQTKSLYACFACPCLADFLLDTVYL